MRLTAQEYQKFRSRFRSMAWPDEDYRVPVDVSDPDGTGGWTAYILGADVRLVRKWLQQDRSETAAVPVEPALEVVSTGASTENTRPTALHPPADTERKAA